MIKKTYFSYPSSDGQSQIQAVKWTDDAEKPKAVIQMIHGMCEYIERYEETAEYFAKKGFLVVGCDQLGHGRTGEKNGEFGYFSKKNPKETLVKDQNRLFKITKKDKPDIPYYFFGHSMGSLVLRQYLASFGEGINGAVICGTAGVPYPVAIFGLGLARLYRLLGRDHKPSRLLGTLVFLGYNGRTEAVTGFDWLCSDAEVVKKYIDDPMCGFYFKVGGYIGLLQLTAAVASAGHLRKLPKDVPMLFISGSEDPVGSYGKAVCRIFENYRNAGVKDVRLRIYDGARHELLNEKIKDEVRGFVTEWIEAH